MSKEVWKDIKDYEGAYQVSNFGRVRSLDRKRWNGKVWCKCKGRILVGRPTKYGYLRVSLGRGDYHYIHRIVAETFLSNVGYELQVNHKDGDKTNNRVENLEWCSCSENMKHASKNSLMRSGESHHNHKLTKQDVDYIRNHHKHNDRTFGYSALSRLFGVSPEAVRRVVRGEAWK